jgi:ABC-2 type transport system permease protein
LTSSFFRLFGRQMDVQFRMRTLNVLSLGLFFIQPAIFSGVAMILSRAAGNATPDLIYTVLGGGIMGMWSGLVFTSTYDIRTDRREGTLELIVGSPTSLRRVEGMRTFTNVLAGLVSLAVAVLAAVLIFRYSFQAVNLVGAGISLLLILFALWCIGVFLANLLAWSRLSGSIVDYLEMPMAVLCGFMFPISILPAWLQKVSAIFPIRWGLEALYESMNGAPTSTMLLFKWILALGISLVFLLFSRWLDQKVHDHIRITGELHSI